jgi:hypothetical protein
MASLIASPENDRMSPFHAHPFHAHRDGQPTNRLGLPRLPKVDLAGLARRRLTDWIRRWDLAESEIAIEWETVEFCGGPYDGLERRLERWQLFNLPARVEFPLATHTATGEHGEPPGDTTAGEVLTGEALLGEALPFDADRDAGRDLPPEPVGRPQTVTAIYEYIDTGLGCRYRFVGRGTLTPDDSRR